MVYALLKGYNKQENNLMKQGRKVKDDKKTREIDAKFSAFFLTFVVVYARI